MLSRQFLFSFRGKPPINALLLLLSLFFVHSLSIPLAKPKEGQKKIIKKSHKKLPDWVGATPKKSGTVFFTGFYSRAESFAEARNGALFDALASVIDYFGVKMKIDVRSEVKKTTRNRKQSEEKSFLSKIEKKGGARLEGYDIKSTYHTEYKIYQGGRWNHLYDAYILVAYKKSYLEKEKRRLKNLYLARRKQALIALKDARESQSNDPIQSLKLALKAMSLAWDTPGAEPVGQEAYSYLATHVSKIHGKARVRAKPARDGTFSSPPVVRYVYDSANGPRPVHGLDLKLSFSQGSGDMVPLARTGSDGEAIIAIRKLSTSLGKKTIKIVPNAEVYLTGLWDEKDPVRQKAFDLLKILSSTLVLGKAKESQIWAMHARLSPSYSRDELKTLRGKLSAFLKAQGFSVLSPEKLRRLKTANPSSLSRALRGKVDLLVIFDLEKSTGSPFQGLQPVTLSGEVRIVDVKSGEVVQSFPYSRVKGVSTRTSDALRKAEAKLAKKFIKDLEVYLSRQE